MGRYGLLWPNTMANVFLLNTVLDFFAKLNSPQSPRLSLFFHSGGLNFARYRRFLFS